MGSASKQVLTREAVVLLIFCHEEAAEAVDGPAVGVGRAVVAGTAAQEGQPGAAFVIESGLF
jgi:hypothetical protein